MNNPLNEDVEGVIKSFIPHSTRLLSLRRQYTMKHLKEGLEKKTVKKLESILTNIISIIKTGFLSEYKQWFYTVGIDVPAALARKRIPFGFLDKYKSTSGNKQSKVDRIMEFYRRACDIVCYKRIPKFYYIFLDNGGRTLHIHDKPISRQSREDLSQRVIKLLCLLTIVLKPSPKPSRLPTPTGFTEVD